MPKRKQATITAPSWMCTDARPQWQLLMKQLYDGPRPRPTPLERIGACILAEARTIATDANRDKEERQAWRVRAMALEVALKMEPIEQRKRKTG